MKIGPLDSLPAASPVAAERRASAAANAHGDTEGLRVELVSRQLLAGEPARADIDQAKVDRIAQAIRDGSFRIDAGAIADKLIANAQELLAPQQR